MRKRFYLTLGIVFLVFSFSWIFPSLEFPRQVAPVVWSKTVQGTAAEPSQAFSQRAKKNRKKSERAPAAFASAPFEVGTDGIKRLRIELKFYCSSWNYLVEHSISEGVAVASSANVFSECLQYAKVATAVTNNVFRNSRVPVVFTFRVFSSDDPYNGANKFVGPNGNPLKYSFEKNTHIDRINYLTSTSYSASGGNEFGRLNNNTFNSNYGIMPAIVYPKAAVLNTVYLLRSDTVTLDKSVRVFFPTGPSVSVPGVESVPCTAPDSLGRVRNFEVYTGMMLNSFLAAPGICGNPGCEAHQSGRSPNCDTWCPCLHIASGDNSSVWNRYASAAGCGAFPGPAVALSNYTACGYRVVQSAEGDVTGFLITPETVFPLRSSLQVLPATETFEWLYRNRNTASDIMPKKNEYAITVLVRPFSEKVNGSSILGMASNQLYYSGGWSMAISAFGGPMAIYPPGNEYLAKYGAVVVNLDAPTALVLPHEIGHLLGGHHERSLAPTSNPDIPPYTASKLASFKLGAYITPDGNFSTIMASRINSSTMYFSTTSFNTTTGARLGIREDNRAEIVRVVNYLGDENLETVPTPKLSAVQQIILKILDFFE